MGAQQSCRRMQSEMPHSMGGACCQASLCRWRGNGETCMEMLTVGWVAALGLQEASDSSCASRDVDADAQALVQQAWLLKAAVLMRW